MLREFGTLIPALVHDPNDQVLADMLQHQATQALLQWEPRILVTSTHVTHSEGEARLSLNYVFVTEPASDQILLPLG